MIDGPGQAAFQPFVERGPDSWVTYGNRILGHSWPAHMGDWRRRRARRARPMFWRHRRMRAAIVRASNLIAARYWLPLNPLLVHLMRNEDAVRPARHD